MDVCLCICPWRVKQSGTHELTRREHIISNRLSVALMPGIMNIAYEHINTDDMSIKTIQDCYGPLIECLSPKRIRNYYLELKTDSVIGL
jgi:hypothetical protein